MNKPAVVAVQKDVECGVISQMKTWKGLSRKGEHFTHQGNIKKMARQQNKMVTSPLLPPVEKKTPKHQEESSLTITTTSAAWEDQLQEKTINF